MDLEAELRDEETKRIQAQQSNVALEQKLTTATLESAAAQKRRKTAEMESSTVYILYKNACSEIERQKAQINELEEYEKIVEDLRIKEEADKTAASIIAAGEQKQEKSQGDSVSDPRVLKSIIKALESQILSMTRSVNEADSIHSQMQRRLDTELDKSRLLEQQLVEAREREERATEVRKELEAALQGGPEPLLQAIGKGPHIPNYAIPILTKFPSDMHRKKYESLRKDHHKLSLQFEETVIERDMLAHKLSGTEKKFRGETPLQRAVKKVARMAQETKDAFDDLRTSCQTSLLKQQSLLRTTRASSTEAVASIRSLQKDLSKAGAMKTLQSAKHRIAADKERTIFFRGRDRVRELWITTREKCNLIMQKLRETLHRKQNEVEDLRASSLQNKEVLPISLEIQNAIEESQRQLCTIEPLIASAEKRCNEFEIKIPQLREKVLCAEATLRRVMSSTKDKKKKAKAKTALRMAEQVEIQQIKKYEKEIVKVQSMVCSEISELRQASISVNTTVKHELSGKSATTTFPMGTEKSISSTRRISMRAAAASNRGRKAEAEASSVTAFSENKKSRLSINNDTLRIIHSKSSWLRRVSHAVAPIKTGAIVRVQHSLLEAKLVHQDVRMRALQHINVFRISFESISQRLLEACTTFSSNVSRAFSDQERELHIANMFVNEAKRQEKIANEEVALKAEPVFPSTRDEVGKRDKRRRTLMRLERRGAQNKQTEKSQDTQSSTPHVLQPRGSFPLLASRKSKAELHNEITCDDENEACNDTEQAESASSFGSEEREALERLQECERRLEHLSGHGMSTGTRSKGGREGISCLNMSVMKSRAQIENGQRVLPSDATIVQERLPAERTVLANAPSLRNAAPAEIVRTPTVDAVAAAAGFGAVSTTSLEEGQTSILENLNLGKTHERTAGVKVEARAIGRTEDMVNEMNVNEQENELKKNGDLVERIRAMETRIKQLEITLKWTRGARLGHLRLKKSQKKGMSAKELTVLRSDKRWGREQDKERGVVEGEEEEEEVKEQVQEEEEEEDEEEEGKEEKKCKEEEGNEEKKCKKEEEEEWLQEEFIIEDKWGSKRPWSQKLVGELNKTAEVCPEDAGGLTISSLVRDTAFIRRWRKRAERAYVARRGLIRVLREAYEKEKQALPEPAIVRVKPVFWVVNHVRCIFDARLQAERVHREQKLRCPGMPEFVYDYFARCHGIVPLVNKACWEFVSGSMIYLALVTGSASNVALYGGGDFPSLPNTPFSCNSPIQSSQYNACQVYAEHSLEIDLATRFIDEVPGYTAAALAFFGYVRECVEGGRGRTTRSTDVVAPNLLPLPGAFEIAMRVLCRAEDTTVVTALRKLETAAGLKEQRSALLLHQSMMGSSAAVKPRLLREGSRTSKTVEASLAFTTLDQTLGNEDFDAVVGFRARAEGVWVDTIRFLDITLLAFISEQLRFGKKLNVALTGKAQISLGGFQRATSSLGSAFDCEAVFTEALILQNNSQHDSCAREVLIECAVEQFGRTFLQPSATDRPRTLGQVLANLGMTW